MTSLRLTGICTSKEHVPTVNRRTLRREYMYVAHSDENKMVLGQIKVSRLQEHVGSDRDCGVGFCEYNPAKGGVVARCNRKMRVCGLGLLCKCRFYCQLSGTSW